MQIKKFEAENMTGALRLIKQEFGPEAVILSAKSMKKEKGVFGSLRKPGVEVTAATDTRYVKVRKNDTLNTTGRNHEYQLNRPDAADLGGKRGKIVTPFRGERDVSRNNLKSMVGKSSIPQDSTKELFRLYQQMLDQDVEEDIAIKLIGEVNRIATAQNISGNGGIKQCLAPILEEMGIAAGRIKIESGKQKIAALIGPTGVGKTTTVAKLATAVRVLEKNKRVGLITLDDCRIAAIEQLKVYGRIIGIPVEVASSNKELKEAIRKLSDKDVILIDTAGMGQRNEGKINELKALFHKIHPVDTHLLLSASTKEKDLADIIERFTVIPVHGLIFTKLDESITYGSILNQLYRTKTPVSYFTNGQLVPEDIEVATLRKLVDLIMDHGEEKRLQSAPPERLAENMTLFENMMERTNDMYKSKRAFSAVKFEKSMAFPMAADRRKIAAYQH